MDAIARRAYRTDLTDAQWEILQPLIPAAKHGGRHRSVNMREVVNTILYLVRTGCQWDMLPHDLLAKSTVYDYFAAWRDDGTLELITRTLREQVRQAEGREPTPSAVSIDSQTIKTTEIGGTRGYDGNKKLTGRKRHVVVDVLGMLLFVLITAANVDDATAAEQILARLTVQQFPRLQVVWADSKYHNHNLNAWLQHFGPNWKLEIVARPEGAQGFVLLPKRWVVERSFAWYGRYRRNSKDYERRTDSSAAMIQLASMNQMLRRLTPLAKQNNFKYAIAA